MNCTIHVTGRVMSPCGRNSATAVVPATLAGMDGDYTPQQVATLLETTDVQLIDVRQPHEHEAGRIAGDRLIELMQLTSQAETIDRDRPVIFYCRSGSRSAMATAGVPQRRVRRAQHGRGPRPMGRRRASTGA